MSCACSRRSSSRKRIGSGCRRGWWRRSAPPPWRLDADLAGMAGSKEIINDMAEGWVGWMAQEALAQQALIEGMAGREPGGRLRNYVGGRWQSPHGGRVLEVVNPATREVMAEVVMSTPEEVDQAVEAAERAFPDWAATPAPE